MRSNEYQRALQTLDAGLEVLPRRVPAPGPADPKGEVASEETEAAAREYVASIKEVEADTVILGCTHYPLITPMLRRLLGPRCLDQLGRGDGEGGQ